MTEIGRELLKKQLEEEIQAIETELENYEQSYSSRMLLKSELKELKLTLKELENGHS